MLERNWVLLCDVLVARNLYGTLDFRMHALRVLDSLIRISFLCVNVNIHCIFESKRDRATIATIEVVGATVD